MLPSDSFSHTPVRLERQLLIYSMCLACRVGKLVSRVDGSLKEWEDGHQCRKNPALVPVDSSGLKTA